MELQEGYYPLPQPDEISIREKEDAMGAYLMMFAAIGAGLPLPIINLIAAIIYYHINKAKSRFVRFHSHQALISTIPTTLINAGVMFWGIRILFFGWTFSNNFKGYLGAAIIANLAYFVIGIIAAIKARKGLFYYYVFFGKISYQKVFAIKEGVAADETPVNNPPKF